MIFFVTFRTRKESVLHSNLFNIILEVSATIIKQTKRKKNRKMWKFLYFRGHDCKDRKEKSLGIQQKMKNTLLEIINKFCKVLGDEVNLQ
jgi:hypothetical protein